jgi:hypothetical protein
VSVFTYPRAPHVRRHGPRGYADYKHYKPWLRDEFSFRCVYCLCRETWLPDGEAHFGVDHVLPRSQAAGLSSLYDSLVYACGVCNAYKKDFGDLIGIDLPAPAEHLAVQPDGSVAALTSAGQTLVEICALNRPELVAFRRDLMVLFAILAKRRGAEAIRLHKRYFGYPDDLPDLASLRPPEGNSRPAGIAASCLEQQRRGELPEFY